MKMLQSSIALACLLGADAFGVVPGSTFPTCDGHTGDLALLADFWIPVNGQTYVYSCGDVSIAADDRGGWVCEDEDANDGNATLSSRLGLAVTLKDVCPETCGVPCGHAPTEDNDAIADYLSDLDTYSYGNGESWDDCQALADAEKCDSELVYWFCGASCRGGGRYNETRAQ